MLTVEIKLAPWITNKSVGDWTLGARRRAGKKGAMAAIQYMRAHSAVRTGRLKDSWSFNSAKGFNVDHEQFIIRLKNDAHEMRRKGEHYYAQYIEYGFHHVWQNYRWHPGHNDRFGAAKAAVNAIVRSLENEDWDTELKMRGGVSGGSIHR
ncbi:MAG: HK97 gp10 family phage protein [Methanocorpusculum sp.]|nr:HK97 gp10 family phage protein [Methanocorpusculum sp.]